jgi:16S rRNA (guanine966-N2)-methyltransferase
MVRQALFNILGPPDEDAVMVDLYAGAGSVGFEALSRGFHHVTFVERDRRHLQVIAQTAERLGCMAACRLVQADVLHWLRGPGAAAIAAADVCFIDAPYQDAGIDTVLALVGASPPPLVVCEHHRERRLPERIGRLGPARVRAYGLTRLTMWEAIEDDDPDGGLSGEL